MQARGTDTKVRNVRAQESCSAGAKEDMRPETAASVTHLARLVRSAQDLPSELRVLDLCTGTGCIPLLFHHEFYSAREDVRLRSLGIDVSNKAIRLARRNRSRLRDSKTSKSVAEFIMADVLVDPFADQSRGVNEPMPFKPALNFFQKPPFWDILISNPPYISPSAFRTTTTRSVRGFEPKLALVPPQGSGKTDTERGDAFYPMLLVAARDVEAKVVLLEVADLHQALRVARMAQQTRLFDGIEIWRDEPDQPNKSSAQEAYEFDVVGRGHGRSVLCWRGQGAAWLGKDMKEVSDTKLSQAPLSSSLEPSFTIKFKKSKDENTFEKKYRVK